MTRPGGGSARSFTRIGDALADFIGSSGIEDRLAEATAVPEWEERVGPVIARVTRPIRVTRATLLVAVRSSAWLMELHMMEQEILQKLNAGRERGRMQRIRFVIDGNESD